MTMRKNNKRALIVSCLSLLLCVSMLVGSTMAWFTDNASTGVNTIQAGTLDIQLLMQASEGNWVDAENKTLEFIDKDDNKLWEPGCIYQLPALKVVNNGSLALKFKLVINRLSDDGAKLAEVLDVGTIAEGTFIPMGTTLAQLAVDPDGAAYGNLTAKGTDGAESNVYPLALRMQTTAGNEYQGLTLETMSITVMAAQDTVESDSFGNTYDEEADYDTSVLADVWDGSAGALPEASEDGTIAITNAEEFAAFAAAVNAGDNFAGKTVKLRKSIDLDGKAWTSISSFAGTFDGQGNTISNLKDAALFGTVNGTVKNLNLSNVSANKVVGGFLANTVNGKVEGCSVKNAAVTSATTGSSGLVGYAMGTAVIDNCSVDNYTLTVTNTEDNRDKVGGLVGQSSGATITNSSVSNITLNGVYKTKEWGGFAGRHANNGIIKNCTATNVKINVSDYAQSVGGFVGASANATIENCDVNGVTIKVNNCGWVGGFAGYIGDAETYNFDDCNVTGMSITLETDAVSGIGGFCGRSAYTLTIKNCSVEGTIDASDAAIATGRIKALVGYDRVDQYPDIMVTENNTTNVTIQ